MGAQVIELGGIALRKKAAPARRPQPADVAPAPRHEFKFWTGASGQPYVHTIYSLLWCPELPQAGYILVSRGADGRRRALRIARAEQEAPSLNLAEIRQLGATLGANEVHVHFLAGSAAQRRAIEADLRAAGIEQAQRGTIGRC